MFHRSVTTQQTAQLCHNVPQISHYTTDCTAVSQCSIDQSLHNRLHSCVTMFHRSVTTQQTAQLCHNVPQISHYTTDRTSVSPCSDRSVTTQQTAQLYHNV